MRGLSVRRYTCGVGTFSIFTLFQQSCCGINTADTLTGHGRKRTAFTNNIKDRFSPVLSTVRVTVLIIFMKE